MVTILIRTLIVYLSLMLVLRLMGKRQIGEMEVTDLVTTLLLSEIASLPVTNLDIPISYAIIPMILLLFLEVGASLLLSIFPNSKKLLSARPAVLVKDGVLDQKMLRDTRMTPEELMAEVRQKGLYDLSQVKDAILEKNGKITLFPFSQYAPPNAGDLSLHLPEEPLSHVVLYQGRICKEGLSIIGKDETWLLQGLKRKHLSPASLFAVTANDAGKLYFIRKEENK